ncbi:integrase [Cucumis melo var. makuwa]|uniref:Integrase n=1 Tax=Cucumis melo var. makuwa TaxID=1194695 RepID=A0A5D3CNF3_CUCMM|nr:integrase [Cucumis melo var. makuwa]TYK13453.1 integrase [Cucumis melo var. makuwa]
MASNGNMLQPQLPRGYTKVKNQSELTNQQLVELRENRKKDKKALFFIYQAVDEFIFERISIATSLQRRLGIFYNLPVKEKIKKYGHFQADCWALKNGDGNTTMNMHKEQKKNDESILFLACSIQDDIVEPTWYLDSGCSNHMTGNRSIFVTLDESFQSEVKTGDNTRLQVKGQCDILVKTKKDTKRVTNVFYVSGLKHNLLSIGQLLQRGLKVSFEGDICAIKDQTDVLIVKITILFVQKSYGKAWRASKPLELIHTDLCGPMRTTTNGAFAENQSGHKIKTLRSDRGGEYIAFGNFFKEQGIHHQMTARMTPQQNGVAERKNRTITKMARSMLKAKNLPNKFWGDAVACTVYILNRAPTKSIPGMTPYEAWCCEKPSVSHLRVFGSLAYSHIPNQLRDENKVAQELEQAEIQAVESSSSSTPSSTTIQDEKWKIAMDQEIDAIRRNET